MLLEQAEDSVVFWFDWKLLLEDGWSIGDLGDPISSECFKGLILLDLSILQLEDWE